MPKFLSIIADSRLSTTPDNDWYIDVGMFMNTIAGELIQAVITNGWGIIVKNDTPFEQAMTKYVKEHGGDVFLNATEGTTIDISIVVTAEDPGAAKHSVFYSVLATQPKAICHWEVKQKSYLWNGRPWLIKVYDAPTEVTVSRKEG